MSDLQAFLSGLDEAQSIVPLETLKAALVDLELSVDDIPECVQFCDDRYARNLLKAGPQYFALVLCWKPGQASPIHDHRGATCGVRVLQGSATETRFVRQDGKLIPVDEHQITVGDVCGSQDADIHEIRNDGSENLVTLHVYSPFLTNIHVYDRETGEESLFCDPLVESMREVNSPGTSS